MFRSLAAAAIAFAIVNARQAPPHGDSCWDAPACTEWVKPGRGPARSLVYRTHVLTTRNPGLTRALVVIHDTDRDAEATFHIALDAAMRAGAGDDTVVVAPRFSSNDGDGCRDRLANDEINWPCDGNSWRAGGPGRGGASTSFDLVDEILRTLANKATFPNLRAIVVAGHSAGGQFVTRYEMANRVHEALGVVVTYVVANPSSYAFPTTERPVGTNATPRFAPFEGRTCPTFDRWPYGLEARRGYVASMTATQLRTQLAARPTTYLLGERDVQPVASFDASCPAMAQGSTRLARGLGFAALVNQELGGHHAVAVVPACGHNARCMLTSDAARSLLFPAR